VEDEFDITKYPEGFDEVVKTLDFLPDDYEIRSEYLVKLILFLNNA
jgi:hypothetical protein